MTSPAMDLATKLASTIVTLTLGTNLFIGTEPSSPVNVVTVYDTGGWAPIQTYSGSKFVRSFTCQIRVRNDTYTTGYALAETIRDALEAVTHETISSNRYLGLFTSSEPTSLGKLETNAGLANVWTINVIAKEDD